MRAVVAVGVSVPRRPGAGVSRPRRARRRTRGSSSSPSSRPRSRRRPGRRAPRWRSGRTIRPIPTPAIAAAARNAAYDASLTRSPAASQREGGRLQEQARQRAAPADRCAGRARRMRPATIGAAVRGQRAQAGLERRVAHARSGGPASAGTTAPNMPSVKVTPSVFATESARPEQPQRQHSVGAARGVHDGTPGPAAPQRQRSRGRPRSPSRRRCRARSPRRRGRPRRRASGATRSSRVRRPGLAHRERSSGTATSDDRDVEPEDRLPAGPSTTAPPIDRAERGPEGRTRRPRCRSACAAEPAGTAPRAGSADSGMTAAAPRPWTAERR